tara:strand:+ start:971 stop:2455 length:1485 start_codon:yes stop_codon:yes gene_type:complete
MDVLENKTLNTDLNFMYNVFKFDNFDPRLVGTGSLKSQLYAADFDFLNIINKEYTPREAYEQFKKVFNNIKNASNLFFIEFKIQEKVKGVESVSGGKRGGKLAVKDIKRFIDNAQNRKERNGKKELEISGYKLDPSLTTDESVVYYHPEKNHVVHSIRATNGTAKDWLNNGVYLASPTAYQQLPRFKNALKTQTDVENKYKDAKKSIVTHSQSGIMGRYMAKERPNTEIIQLNPASSWKDNTVNDNDKNVYTIKSTKDLVSSFHKPKPQDIIIKGDNFNQEKQHDIGLLDKLDPEQMVGFGKGEEPVKTKIFDMKDFNLNLFEKNYKNVDLCKIDCIIYLKNGMFKEVSCIFFFNPAPLDTVKYRGILLEDQKQYFDLKKYYKSLKRIMVAAKYQEPIDNNFIILITALFNSSIGKLYELDNEIQAAIIYMNKYGADDRIKMFINDAGLGKMSPDKLEDISNDYQNLINREALSFYKKYKIPVGKLPKFNTIKL